MVLMLITTNMNGTITTTTTNITATAVITTMIFFSRIDFYLLPELIPMEISLSIERNDVCNDLFSCFLCFDFLIIWVPFASASDETLHHDVDNKQHRLAPTPSVLLLISTSTSKHTTPATKSTITTNKTHQHYSLMLLTIYPWNWPGLYSSICLRFCSFVFLYTHHVLLPFPFPLSLLLSLSSSLPVLFVVFFFVLLPLLLFTQLFSLFFLPHPLQIIFPSTDFFVGVIFFSRSLHSTLSVLYLLLFVLLPLDPLSFSSHFSSTTTRNTIFLQPKKHKKHQQPFTLSQVKLFKWTRKLMSAKTFL